MIIEWFLQVLGGFVSFVVGLFGFIPDPPAFFTDLPAYVANIAGYMAGTAVWVPWGLTLSVLGLWAAALFAAVTIRLVRIVASFMTGGGGGAA